MKNIFRLIAIIAVLLSGCRKEEQLSLPPVPQWYRDMLSLHSQDKVFVKAAKDNGDWVISFTDMDYRISAGDVVIYDCSLTGEPNIHLDDRGRLVAQ